VAEVVTGEAVVLDLAVARFPSRMVALLVDILVQLPVLAFLELVVFSKAARHLNNASAAAIYTAGFVLVLVGYPTIFETLSRGKTLGKMALGLRVVSDDGSPIRFRQALIRALTATFVEIWNPALCFVGLITAMVSAKGKRLGDMVAGTFVIQERVPRRRDLSGGFAVVPPPLAAWAQNLEVSRLSDHTAAAASSYLRRFNDLRPAARDELGWQLASVVAAQVSPAPPAGTPHAAYLSAVLAVRRDREHARLRARQAAQPGPGYPAVTAQLPPGVLPALPLATSPAGPPAYPPAYPGTLPALPPTTGSEPGAENQPGHGTWPAASGAVPPRPAAGQAEDFGFAVPG
jgi:uncharacterized RDD family membrane protein YckC